MKHQFIGLRDNKRTMNVKNDLTVRGTERKIYRVLPRGNKGETLAAKMQFMKDYTSTEMVVRVYHNQKQVDILKANMFTYYKQRRGYATELIEFNRRQREETGYLFE